MKLKIKDDGVLKEISSRLALGGIALMAGYNEVAELFSHMFGLIRPYYYFIPIFQKVFLILGAVTFISGLLVQPYSKINKQKIENIMFEGYKMQVKVVEIQKKFLSNKYRVKAVYAFTSTDSGEYFLSPKSLDEKTATIPIGSQVDIYIDPNDQDYYYMDLTKYVPEENTIKELREMMKRPKKGYDK